MPGKGIVVAKLAVLPFRFADPSGIFPLATKLTLPVGMLDPVMVAVKVTCADAATLAALDTTLIDVGLAVGVVPPPPAPLLVDEPVPHPSARLIVESRIRQVDTRQRSDRAGQPKSIRLTRPMRKLKPAKRTGPPGKGQTCRMRTARLAAELLPDAIGVRLSITVVLAPLLRFCVTGEPPQL